MSTPKIAAIVPAYNEKKTIAAVVKTLQRTAEIDEIIVVDDGSSDTTGEIARSLGVTVISQKNKGKGAAMRVGALLTEAPILFFSDADLEGLAPGHIRLLLSPVIKGDAAMSVGILDRGWLINHCLRSYGRILGGERAIRREDFLALSGRGVGDFGIETVMNNHCAQHKLPVSYVVLSGLHHVIKEKKYGLVRGFRSRIKMIGQVLRADIGRKL